MNGVFLIAQERRRQVTDEQFSAERDDAYTTGQLSQAAAAYATVGSATIRGASAEEFPADMMHGEGEWPDDWDAEWWKPSDDPIRNLVKAGALIAAEIDRMLRDNAKGTNAHA